MASKFSFEFVEPQLRKKTFGILTTISPKGWPQTHGVLYGMAAPHSKLAFFIVTDKRYRKAGNIKGNPRVSFLIPFPHYYVRFAPASTVQFQGTAKLIPIDNPQIFSIFKNGPRVLRRVVHSFDDPAIRENYCFIKITPNPRFICYGLGKSLRELRKDHVRGRYTVTIPQKRR
ncbi:MAG: pyridoxamine 5'-phosphate oxidase family protein [Candidatus Hodarchaeales archaeon]|jgi:hypothetical protein